jgi:undecaprenyl-diphosphatase
MIIILKAIILGIVEGLTEFLPISSTGHLLLTERALGYKDEASIFSTIVQVGAICAAAWFFRSTIISTVKDLLAGKKQARMFLLHVFIGLIPAGVLGLVLEKFDLIPTSPLIIAAALIVGGIGLWWVENRQPTRLQHKVADYSNLSAISSLKIGLWQCLALIPGVSRSGATIAGGLLSGLDRATATGYSFFLSMPLLAAASLLKAVKYSGELSTLPGGIPALAVGTLASFVSAFIVVGWLLKYIQTHSFKPFAYYRIALGALILLLVATNVL